MFFYSIIINFDFFYFKVIIFFNFVYEFVYCLEISLGLEIFCDKDFFKVEFCRSKVDFLNFVYEVLLVYNGLWRFGMVFWGSIEDMNG